MCCEAVVCRLKLSCLVKNTRIKNRAAGGVRRQRCRRSQRFRRRRGKKQEGRFSLAGGGAGGIVRFRFCRSRKPALRFLSYVLKLLGAKSRQGSRPSGRLGAKQAPTLQ
jgi:hypothetical protein